jgi:transposase InsO family protein
VFFKVYAHQTQENAVDFLNALREACPTRIETILTDNGTPFTDRFLKPDKKASGKHPFDRACAQSKIGHRLIPPRHPQTNAWSSA